MTVNQLAKESGVDRMTITKLEKGGSRYRDSTVGQLTSTLDRIEHELGMDQGVRPVGDPAEGFLEITMEGVYGVRSVVVKGPVSDPDAIRKLARDLMRDIRQESNSETDHGTTSE